MARVFRRTWFTLVAGLAAGAALPALGAWAAADDSRLAQVAPVAGTDEIGSRLFALAGEAVAAGIDPETALRRTARAYRDAIRATESEDASTP